MEFINVDSGEKNSPGARRHFRQRIMKAQIADEEIYSMGDNFEEHAEKVILLEVKHHLSITFFLF